MPFFSVVQLLGTAENLKILTSSNPDDAMILELVGKVKDLNPSVDNVSALILSSCH